MSPREALHRLVEELPDDRVESAAEALQSIRTRRSAQPDALADEHPEKTIGHALDRFIGTWTAEEEAEVLEAIEVFERVDEAFWR